MIALSKTALVFIAFLLAIARPDYIYPQNEDKVSCIKTLSGKPQEEEKEAEEAAEEEEEEEKEILEQEEQAPTIPILPEFETVVTADRSEERAFESIRAVESMDLEKIERGLPVSVPEAVKDLPGLHLQETNRGAGSPILRGRVGPDNLIIIDGVRFNTSTFRTGPNQYLSTIDLDSVERIEVLRGPSSVLYGNGAFGGVIHLITETPKLNLAFPAFSGSTRASISSADRSGGIGTKISASKGPMGTVGGMNFSNYGDLRAGGGFVQPHTAYRKRGWHGKLVYQPSVDWTLTGAYFGSMILDAGRTDLLGRKEIRFYDNTDHLSYISANWRGYGFFRELKAVISFHRLLESQQRLTCGSDVDIENCIDLDESILLTKRRGMDTVNSIGADLSARASLLDRRLEIIAGADAYRDMVDSFAEKADSESGFVFESLPRGSFSSGSSYLTLGSFLHGRAILHDQGLGAPKLRFELGGRASAFMADALDVPSVGDLRYRHAGFVGSAGLQYYRPGSYNIYTSFMQGFRAPNLQETTVLGSTGSKFEIPNEDLRPERSDTFEIGAKLQTGLALLQLAAYRSYLVDAIDEEPALWDGERHVDGAPVVQRVNAASGIYEGLEAGAMLFFWRFQFATAAAWTIGNLSTASGELYPARRIPPVFGNMSLGYHDPLKLFFSELLLRWALRQDSLHPSDLQDARICGIGLYRDEIDENCRGNPGYLVMDLRAGIRPTSWSRIMLIVSNLGDLSYRTHGSGFDASGFGLRTMFEITY